MMKSITSNQLSDFADIYLDDIELISVDMPNSDDIEYLSRQFIKSRQDLKLQWVLELEDKKSIDYALPKSIESPLRSMLINQISASSEMLAELLGCNKVGVRLATLRSPMCPRFHVDKIPCRLLITLCGGGTEWIANKDVNWKIFADTNDTTPVKDNAEIQRFKTGHWSLLKGGAWNNNFSGVVHRSPHEIDKRLLLSLDPIFD